MLEAKHYDPLQRMYGSLSYQGTETIATNGTTAVAATFAGSSANGSATSGSPRIDINAVTVISNDTTAGNITVSVGASAVATIAKGTTAGAMTGATSLTNNTNIASGSSVTAVSSSAGNATVLVYYTAY